MPHKMILENADVGKITWEIPDGPFATVLYGELQEGHPEVIRGLAQQGKDRLIGNIQEAIMMQLVLVMTAVIEGAKSFDAKLILQALKQSSDAHLQQIEALTR